MAMRREFEAADLSHLANLCHGCKGCYHASQYAPPYAFGINIPATFAIIRAESYAQYAWPQGMGQLFEHNGTLMVALALLLAVAFVDPAALFSAQTGTGAFFRIIPLWLINLLAGASFLFAIVAMGVGAMRYWRGIGGLGGKLTPACGDRYPHVAQPRRRRAWAQRCR